MNKNNTTNFKNTPRVMLRSESGPFVNLIKKQNAMAKSTNLNTITQKENKSITSKG